MNSRVQVASLYYKSTLLCSSFPSCISIVNREIKVHTWVAKVSITHFTQYINTAKVFSASILLEFRRAETHKA